MLHEAEIDPEEEEEARIWASIKEKRAKLAREERERLEEEERQRRAIEDPDDNEEKGVTNDDFTFTHKYRRQHFKHRLLFLEDDITRIKKERHEINAERAKRTEVMKKEQARQMELQLEKDRIKNYKGELVSSDVLHGSTMRYNVKVELLLYIDLKFAFRWILYAAQYSV